MLHASRSRLATGRVCVVVATARGRGITEPAAWHRQVTVNVSALLPLPAMAITAIPAVTALRLALAGPVRAQHCPARARQLIRAQLAQTLTQTLTTALMRPIRTQHLVGRAGREQRGLLRPVCPRTAAGARILLRAPDGRRLHAPQPGRVLIAPCHVRPRSCDGARLSARAAAALRSSCWAAPCAARSRVRVRLSVKVV